MSHYQELLARKRELDKNIEQMRRTESAEALKTIHDLIATFGFTAVSRVLTKIAERGAKALRPPSETADA